MNSDNRKEQRFLTDLELTLLDRSGVVIDDKAMAHDLSTGGFRAETRIKLPEKTRVRFLLKVEEEADIRGEAVVVWASEDQWGWFNVGLKTVSITWKDARRIRRLVIAPGYDFMGLAKRAAIAAYWIVVVVGIQAALMSPHVRHTLVKLGPIVPAVVLLGWSLTMIANKD